MTGAIGSGDGSPETPAKHREYERARNTYEEAVTELDDEVEFDEDEARSIFSETWFRVVLVVIVLGVIGAVAGPYVLDSMGSRIGTAVEKTATVTDAKASVEAPAGSADAPAGSADAPAGSADAAAPGVTSATGAATPPPLSAATSDASSAKPMAIAASATAPPTPAPPATTVAPAGTQQPAAMAPKPATTGESAATKDTSPATAAAPKPRTAVKPAAIDSPKTSPLKVAATPREETSVVKSGGGEYFVQVGAFKSAETAHRIATRLREQKYHVEESVTPGREPGVEPATDRYSIFVAGVSPAELQPKLAGKALTGEAVSGGVQIRPVLPLRDAVELSRTLEGDDLKVQVRRVGVGGGNAAPSGERLHRVRVGGFPDRDAALAARKDLEAKGYQTYVARSGE